MNKIKYLVCILVIACLVDYTFSSEVRTKLIDGIVWHYTLENREITIGSQTGTFAAIENNSQGRVEIPVSIEDCQVKTIGSEAFYGQESLSSVNIPTGVQNICSHAFADCTNLTFTSIPNTLTNIGASAFSGCSSLTNFLVPEGLQKLNKSTFSSCRNLQTITLPSSLKEVGETAFLNCTSLKSLTLSEQLEIIRRSAFVNCKSLESLIIPNLVTNIESAAFAGCSTLKSINVPSRIEALGRENCVGVFRACTSLSSITFNEGLKNLPGEICNLCFKLKEIVLPDSITNIGSRAFVNGSLEKIVIGRGVQTIGTAAFANNGKLTSVEFRGDAPQFGQYVFSGLVLGGILGSGAPTNCAFRIHRGTTGWNIIEPSSTNESPRIQFDGRFFPVEYVDDVSEE